MKCDEIFAALAHAGKGAGHPPDLYDGKDRPGADHRLQAGPRGRGECDRGRGRGKARPADVCAEGGRGGGREPRHRDVPARTRQGSAAKHEVGDMVNIPVDNVENSAASPPATASRSSSRACGRPSAAWSTTSSTPSSTRSSPASSPASTPAPARVALRIGTGAEATEAILAARRAGQGRRARRGRCACKVYVVDVRRSTRGPQVLISRTHPGLGQAPL